MKKYTLFHVSEGTLFEASDTQPGQQFYLASEVDARIAELERKNRLLSQRLFDLDEELLTQLSGWARTKSHDLIVKLLAECRTS